MKNPIHSVFLFIATILNMSVFLLCLNIDFFAFMLLMVYVGAIMILFLFIVMLLNIKIYERAAFFFKYLPASFIIIFLVILSNGMTLAEDLVYIKHDKLYFYIKGFFYMNVAAQLYFIDALSVIGYMLFTHFWFVVVLLSLLLLMAIIGSIVLTFNNVGNFKKQEIFSQIERDFNKILKFKKTQCF